MSVNIAPANSASSTPPRQGSHGFTLIELLVVVAIIALLIALLLPALGRARGLSQIVRCGANERQIYMGFTYYASDYRGMYPVDYGAVGVGPWPTIGFFDWWVSYVMLYTKEATPADATKSWQTTTGIWRCPSSPRLYCSTGMTGNYAYNSELAYNFVSTIGTLGPPQQWKKSDSLLMLVDAGGNDPLNVGLGPTVNWTSVQAGWGARYNAGNWHNGGSYNAVFLDGHVATGNTLPADKQLPGEYFPQWLLWNNRW
ncbi:MAG: prepilin-type N-terminal cleavage/methylation domain-containing protein [Phycisphaerae bacterium]